MNAPMLIALGLAWIVLALTVLTWGTAASCRLLGEEECLPQGRLAPPFFGSGALALSAAWWLRAWAPLSLAVAFGIPVVVAAAWSLHLRFAQRAARKKEFGWRDERLVRIADGAALHPTFAKSTSAYLRTGPSSGYSLYALQLFDDGGVIARNRYVHERAVRRDLDRLARLGCEHLDAQVVWQASPTVLYACHLGPWAELFCGRPEAMPEASRRFWQQWVRPRFPAEGSAEVATAELRAHLAPLVEAEPREGERLRRLLERAGPSVRIMTERARRALERDLRGRRGLSLLEREDGIPRTTVFPKN